MTWIASEVTAAAVAQAMPVAAATGVAVAAAAVPRVPEWPQFLEGCIRYRRSLDEQAPQAPRTDEPCGG